jgi:ABC-type glycerol-3-phosphate transport system permease component
MSGTRRAGRQLTQHVVLVLVIVVAFVPFVFTLLLSLRTTSSIYLNFFTLPWPPNFGNYSGALVALGPPILRSLLVCACSIAGVLILAAPCAYALARLKFAGRTLVYRAVLLVLFVPSVILLTPLFSLARGLGLVGSLGGLIVYYIATSLPLAIFLLTPFLAAQEEQIFEAARIDGAGDIRMLVQIAVPLALPIIATIAIMTFLNLYNDFIWPSLVLRQDDETAILALTGFAPPTQSGFSSRPDVGLQTAGYVVVALPQLVVLGSGMRFFIQGITSGAIR